MDQSGFDGGDELTILSRAELAERVRQRTADLENVMNTMADVLLKLGPDGRIRLANAAATDVLGYEEEKLIGKPIDLLLADDRPGDQLSVMLTSGEFIELLLSEERVTDLETYLVTASGDEVPTSLSASVMYDDGEIDGIVCVATDIAERKEAEDRAEFLHSLLRHDLGNKLTVTDGYLELLSETDLNDTQREYLEYAHNGVREVIDLVENVRMLSKLEDEEAVRSVGLDRIIRESADRHRDLAEPTGIEIETEVESGLRVTGGTLLKELFSNLIENALVHSGGTVVRVTAETDSTTTGDTDTEPTDTADPEPIIVRVEDDGQGIPVDPPETILERGKTVSENAGTGLGTYLANRIAETYGGSIDVSESKLGGACFCVVLERAE